jgi:hypothetical protein
MSDLRDQIRSHENAFQRLLDAIPGFDGYREREIRRTADKLLREHLVAELDRVRAKLRDIVGQWSRAGRLEMLDDIDRLSRLMGKARDSLRFADYGYTGFFDAIKIKEEQLDQLYEYDLSLRELIVACDTAVDELGAAGEEALAEKMKAVEAAIGQLQETIDRREQVAAAAVATDA